MQFGVSARFNREVIKYLADCLQGQEGGREGGGERERGGDYPNGLCGSWGAGNEDGMLASSLQSTTTLRGLSTQRTAGCTHKLICIRMRTHTHSLNKNI